MSGIKNGRIFIVGVFALMAWYMTRPQQAPCDIVADRAITASIRSSIETGEEQIQKLTDIIDIGMKDAKIRKFSAIARFSDGSGMLYFMQAVFEDGNLISMEGASPSGTHTVSSP